MREDCHLNTSFLIYEYFVYKFKRITVYLNNKGDELKILEEKTAFDQYFKRLDVI